jgi:hypothetical protein
LSQPKKSHICTRCSLKGGNFELCAFLLLKMDTTVQTTLDFIPMFHQLLSDLNQGQLVKVRYGKTSTDTTTKDHIWLSSYNTNPNGKTFFQSTGAQCTFQEVCPYTVSFSWHSLNHLLFCFERRGDC